jgi:hypothetical protein
MFETAKLGLEQAIIVREDVAFAEEPDHYNRSSQAYEKKRKP